MARMTRYLALATIAGLLASCENGTGPTASGSLYFGAGYYIGEFDLASGASYPIANLGEVEITHLSGLSDDELLVSIMSTKETRNRFHVLRFNLDSQQSHFTLNGTAARYLPDSQAILYDDGLALLWFLRRSRARKPATIYTHSHRIAPSYLSTGDGLILFESMLGDSNQIRQFNLSTQESTALPRISDECRLRGALWIGDRRQLLCQSPQTSASKPAYRLVSIDGQVSRELELPTENRFRAVSYLDDQGLLVLSESVRTRFDSAARNAVWLYDLETGDSRRISDDQHLGHSVVYRSKGD